MILSLCLFGFHRPSTQLHFPFPVRQILLFHYLLPHFFKSVHLPGEIVCHIVPSPDHASSCDDSFTYMARCLSNTTTVAHLGQLPTCDTSSKSAKCLPWSSYSDHVILLSGTYGKCGIKYPLDAATAHHITQGTLRRSRRAAQQETRDYFSPISSTLAREEAQPRILR
jgi:hypothetical protein